jgi:hypothetical protein
MFIPTRSPEPDGELARNVITAEYGYIAQTAFQANEDRARAWQYFFVTFATLIAALLSTQVGDEATLFYNWLGCGRRGWRACGR